MFVMNIDGSDVRIFQNNDDTIIEDIPATWSIDEPKSSSTESHNPRMKHKTLNEPS